MTDPWIAWAAGLFEGEGSVGMDSKGYPRITLGMTDPDVRREPGVLPRGWAPVCGSAPREGAIPALWKGADMRYDEDDFAEYDEDEWRDRVEMFADPGGNSALRAATKDNPRNLPCPTCGWPNRLTPADRARGYQCDSCADAAEQGRDIDYYEEDDDDDDADR